MSVRIEIDGREFLVKFNSSWKPYVLKERKWNQPRSRRYWGIVWAEWHKGLPTGIRAKAIEATGFRWNQQNQSWDEVVS